MRPLKELIDKEDPAWKIVESWIDEAKNEIEILPKDSEKADLALYQTQVTSKSPMGAIIHETGGILVDHGWLRILASGSEKLKRNLPEWNKGKSFKEYGQPIPFLLVADDAIGGFFALNGGAFGEKDLGKVYYFSPDALDWEPLDVSYSDFIYWAFTSDLDEFYGGLRWSDWKEEVEAMSADQGMNFFPFLWTKYEDLEKLNRKAVPIEELWNMQMDVKNQLEG